MTAYAPEREGDFLVQTMRAAVLREPGGPEQLRLESVPIPAVNRDQVLIRVKAFGLNRSEMFTRQGHSPDVKLPRILGIEAVGTVEEATGDEFRKGDTVATVMGGMGRSFDGGSPHNIRGDFCRFPPNAI